MAIYPAVCLPQQKFTISLTLLDFKNVNTLKHVKGQKPFLNLPGHLISRGNFVF